jgi:hypothetical protein
MRLCLTVAVRHRITRPIHFCFSTEEGRDEVTRGFIKDIEQAGQ